MRNKDIEYFSNGNLKTLICVVFVIFCTLPLSAQRLSKQFLSYIDQYKEVAIRQAQEYGIPAAITLAQGLLESGAGQSRLAKEGNNHFGIKCFNWSGDRISVENGSRTDYYRKYDKASESFEDHARFLKGSRYTSLYQLPITDYKGWAKGLKSCGYAEDPAYAVLLIRLIETYKLYQYDKNQPVLAHRTNLEGDDNLTHEDDKEAMRALLKKVELLHPVKRKWGLHYIVVMKGDTYENIALEFNIKTKKLLEFNDIKDKKAVPTVGEKVWVEKKAATAPTNFDIYKVRKGDTPWSISQMYGIRLSTILKLNDIKADAELSPGDEIRLR